MSTFKSNMDAMFAKIFPAAADVAQEDHGGFNIGDLVVIVLDLVLLIYTGYRSWHFLSGSVSSDFQILALVGLWGVWTSAWSPGRWCGSLAPPPASKTGRAWECS